MPTENTLITAGATQLVTSFQIAPTTADEILASFRPTAETLQALDKRLADFNKEIKGKDITPEIAGEAKALRLLYVKVRTGSKEIHDDIKAATLLRGKAIDGAYNIFKLKTTEREDPLMEIEKHFENLEIERKQKVKEERIEMLRKLGKDDAEFKYLDEMTEEIWIEFYGGVKSGVEKAARVAKDLEEKEKKAAIRREEIHKEELRYFIDGEDFAKIPDMTDDTFDLLTKSARAKKALKEKEDEGIRLANVALEKKNKIAEAAAKKAIAAAAAVVETARKARVAEEGKADARRLVETVKLGILKYLPKSLTGVADSVGKLTEEEWIKERDAAIILRDEEIAKTNEKATKNRAYAEWLERNEASNELVAKGDFVVQRDGDTFILFKAIDKLAL